MALAVLAAGLCACVSPHVAYNPRFDFGNVKRVAVVSFDGPQGDAAADLLTQSLISHGAQVVERRQLDAVLAEQHLQSSGLLDPGTIREVGKILGVDALFIGSVIEDTPSQSFMVAGKPGRWGAEIAPLGNSSVFSGGPVPGVPDSQVLTSAAQVSMVSRMVDVETGSILWSASMSYEGFDIQTVMAEIADAFADSLVPVWPALVLKR